ncbi:mannose-6-phosphate isomerase, class I [Kingella negevensis]|uniref:mannose-6-phosphate isomerase, class I n=1 Tax=Kingella negevensis TaxID=1522312 RepID=UPI000A270326|nr:mannose-6-phosphate isomerase, class I [Kingella negevensis]WII91614.1 mannose-6-phosphate isomerase, class I [Kingella negevensis]
MQPLFLKSTFHDKIWGGNTLRTQFGYEIPTETTGEFWAISAHPNGMSTIANGEHTGKTLAQLFDQHRELFGNSTDKQFPLLTKILDAQDWLSVQVHPNDAYAAEHENSLGKTECWYIIAADEGAEIVYGHHATSREQLAQYIKDGKWNELLCKVKVKAGDFFHVPSGTIHAIGKGILILETQQSSDTTYRVYDFDRKDAQGNKRDLHIQQSIDVATIGALQNSHPDTQIIGNCATTTYVSNEFFTVYKWQISGCVSMKKNAPYTLVSVLNGSGSLKIGSETFALKKGEHFILTSDIPEWTFDGNLEMIASHV